MKFFAAALVTLFTIFLTFSSVLALPASDNIAARDGILEARAEEIECGPSWIEFGSRRFRLRFRGVSEANWGQSFLWGMRALGADVRNWQCWKEGDWYIADFSLDNTFLGLQNARNGCGNIVAAARACW